MSDLLGMLIVLVFMVGVFGGSLWLAKQIYDKQD